MSTIRLLLLLSSRVELWQQNQVVSKLLAKERRINGIKNTVSTKPMQKTNVSVVIVTSFTIDGMFEIDTFFENRTEIRTFFENRIEICILFENRTENFEHFVDGR